LPTRLTRRWTTRRGAGIPPDEFSTCGRDTRAETAEKKYGLTFYDH